ncbi:MAG: response regulator [Lachnospiraceae bacterium]|nr:response regulator [Lachnospiraceae bacterium]
MMKNKKLLIWPVVLIIISFIFTTCISMNSLNTVIEGNNEEMSKVLTSKVYDSINNKLSEPIIVAQTMSSDYYLIEPLRQNDFPNKDMEETLISYLNTLSTSMDYSSAFIVSEKSRTYYTQKGFNKIVSPETDEHDIWYSIFVDSGKKYDFDVDTDEVHDDAWTVFVNSRIEDENGDLLGVCGVSVVMTDLQDIFCSYEKEYGIKINLVNSEGLVQVDTDMINIENAVLDITVPDAADSDEYVYQETDNGGYRVSKYVENLGWYLVVQHDGENNNKIYSELIYKNVIAFIIISLICILMVSSNLTIEKKKMEERALEKERYAKEQEALKVQAEAASKAKGDFLANMSHEIRTPINAVLGMDEMILRESREEKIRDYAADIKRAGNTLLSLINDILDFSKIESGKMDIVLVNYDLGSVLNDLLNMMQPKIKNKNLILELNIEPDTPAHLYGDEVRIKQIITNILTNAIKYTQEGKVTLTVSGKKTGEDAVLLYVSVKDTGIGIKDEDQKYLFDSFQRVDESRNRNIEGTGLGLSITMCLLNLMGSSLEVESTYGKGSDFYFYLEQKQLDEHTIGDFQKNYKHANDEVNVYTEHFAAPGAKILVVDDNEMNLKVFQGLLKNSKMQIDTAICGKDCLTLMQQQSYHIIFMDHLMPEMDGVETLKRAKELEHNLSKDAVMVALTANAVSGAREIFLGHGFDDYLSKPIIALKLEEMIKKYLPKELIWSPDFEQPVREPAKGSSDQMAQKNLVDWEKGKELCMGDEEFYMEILHTFLDSHSDIQLNAFFEASDFDNYRIKVHSMKTNLANIGAMEVSDMAKRLEFALKNDNDVSYVQNHHEEFLSMYRCVVSEVEEYL